MRYLIAAAATAAFVFIGVNIPAPAFGHGGGQDQYGGHVEKKTGEYHCHGKPGTEKRDRCNMHVKIGEMNAALRKAAAENAGLLQQVGRKDIAYSVKVRELGEALRQTDTLDRDLRTAKRTARDATRSAATARAHAETARRDMREAEARAAGAGPAVSSRCKDGVVAAIDDSGWTFSRAEKAALRRACLD